MAMVKCKECGKEIDDNIRKCPFCKHKLKSSPLKIAIRHYNSVYWT